MQNRKTLGTICLGTLAVLATTLTISLPAGAADSARSSTSTFKRTKRPTSMTRTRTTTSKPRYKKPVRRTSPATTSAGDDTELPQDGEEVTKAQLLNYIRTLQSRIRRLEHHTGYSRARRNSQSSRRSLNSRVSTLERDLAPILAKERRARRSRRAGAVRRKQTQKAVRDTVKNTRNAAQNAAKTGGKAAKKTADGISQGINNGVKQAQDTLGNMMPGGN